MKKYTYTIYGVTNEELKILEQEGFEFIEELPYLDSKTWNVIFECDRQYLNMVLHAIRRD